MKRSTKTPASPVNRLFFAILLLLAFAGSRGLATVWLRHEISAAAESNMQLQTRIVEVQRRTAEANAEIAGALNPEVLLGQNSTLRLGLEMPREHQIVSVVDAVEVRLAAKRNSDHFTTAFISTSFPLSTPR